MSGGEMGHKVQASSSRMGGRGLGRWKWGRGEGIEEGGGTPSAEQPRAGACLGAGGQGALLPAAAWPGWRQGALLRKPGAAPWCANVRPPRAGPCGHLQLLRLVGVSGLQLLHARLQRLHRGGRLHLRSGQGRRRRACRQAHRGGRVRASWDVSLFGKPASEAPLPITGVSGAFSAADHSMGPCDPVGGRPTACRARSFDALDRLACAARAWRPSAPAPTAVSSAPTTA
jgi:hypothetical protein